MASRQGACPGAIPGNRTNYSNKSRTSLCSRVSKTQLAWGSTRATCHFFGGRGRQAMHLPCKQVDVGALPTDSTNFLLRETRPRHREKLHKLLQVGVTPTPATNFREVIRLPDRKLLAQGHHCIRKNCPCGSTVTSTSRHFCFRS